MNEVVSGVITVATGIIGVAILAVVLSQRANTAGVIKSAGGAFAQTLQAATNPYSGGGGGGVLQKTSFLNTGFVDNNYY